MTHFLSVTLRHRDTEQCCIVRSAGFDPANQEHINAAWMKFYEDWYAALNQGYTIEADPMRQYAWDGDNLTELQL